MLTKGPNNAVWVFGSGVCLCACVLFPCPLCTDTYFYQPSTMANAVRLSAVEVPSWRGPEDLEDWLQRVDAVAACNRWDDQQKVNYVARAFCTELGMLAWYLQLPMADRTDWNNFSQRLRDDHRPRDWSAKRTADLYSRQQGILGTRPAYRWEGLRTYATALERLHDQSDVALTADDMRERFIMGLAPHFLTLAMSKEWAAGDTVSTVLEHLVPVEVALNTAHPPTDRHLATRIPYSGTSAASTGLATSTTATATGLLPSPSRDLTLLDFGTVNTTPVPKVYAQPTVLPSMAASAGGSAQHRDPLQDAVNEVRDMVKQARESIKEMMAEIKEVVSQPKPEGRRPYEPDDERDGRASRRRLGQDYAFCV